jgi:hypothetical protein
MFMYGVLGGGRYVHPEVKLTRGEVAKLLCSYLRQKPMRNKQVFSDVPTSHQYAPYIWAMTRLGIMTGDSDGAFRPDNELSMQEFAVVAQRVSIWGKAYLTDRVASLQYYTSESPPSYETNWKAALSRFDSPPNNKPKVFADADKIASWAKPAVDEFSQLGILSGDGNGYLKPTEPLSRLRFLVFLEKFDALLGGSTMHTMIFSPSVAVF